MGETRRTKPQSPGEGNQSLERQECEGSAKRKALRHLQVTRGQWKEDDLGEMTPKCQRGRWRNSRQGTTARNQDSSNSFRFYKLSTVYITEVFYFCSVVIIEDECILAVFETRQCPIEEIS